MLTNLLFNSIAMATECSQEAVLRFLTDRGGRVKNLELIDFFKCVFPTDPEKKAVIREYFKGFVDNIAFVKIENDVKFVCLRKKYRGSVKCVEKDTRDGIKTGETSVSEQEDKTALHDKGQPISECPTEPEMSPSEQVSSEITANGAAQQEISPVSPVSGYGTRKALPQFPDIVLQSKTSQGIQPVAENNADMGNTCTSKKNIDLGSPSGGDTGTSSARPPDIPRIALIEASPLPAEADGSMFTLPGVETLGQADTLGLLSSQEKQYSDSESVSLGATQGRKEPNVCRADVTRRRPLRESQRSLGSSQPSEDWAGDLQSDSLSASGSDSNTPKGSRKNFIELMMNSSPQVRRSLALRNSVHLTARHSASDSDSASLVSSLTDDEGASVALDPLEHAWMVCSADGEWEGLQQLLACEPHLILKKDFVTGFTVLHWAAKQGKPELLALIVNFAKQQSVPLNINARSSAGYTALHMAAMHNHVEVVKLLVGAYDADVEVRDYSGKKACQYLKDGVALDVRDIIGAAHDDDPESTDHGFGVRWRLSKVLHPNRTSPKPRKHQEEDAGPARATVLRRKSSLSKKKPRQNVRLGTQIIHSKSFRDSQEMGGSLGSLLRSRPKSSLFG